MTDQPKKPMTAKDEKPTTPEPPIDTVQEADEESFPASDAPAWANHRPHKPHPQPEKKPEDKSEK